ncbi:xanthine dehydrogenase family protein subunit M [Anaerolinea thermophila]|uniref:FAD binding domain-containing protein n=2 Tax=Anaerolinea TaxID=233189 RepID=UPI0026F2F9D1|nr:FAD binding domain-containing protein [Anaerolinea thermophila]
MIIEYHRPDTLDQALALLSRQNPPTLPLGGGSYLSRHTREDVAVVDLQKLGLDFIESTEKGLSIGATTRLQTLVEHPEIPQWLKQAAHRETSANLRRMQSLAGTLVTCNGRSILGTVLLAADARLYWLPQGEEKSLGDYFALRLHWNQGLLIRSISIPTKVKVASDWVARTPKDLPVLVVAVAQWPSKRTRVVVGGFGNTPLLVLDGPEPGGVDVALKSVLKQSTDEWASSEYRMDVGEKLLKRLLKTLEALEG